MDKAVFNIPNMLSWFRLLLVPVYWMVFFAEPTLTAAFIVFAIASFTDLLDGYIARKFNMITKYGKVLDPFADKCMIVSAIISLVIAGRLFWLFAAIIAVKEIYMVVCGIILFKRKVVVYSNIMGKVMTFVMFVGLTLLYCVTFYEGLQTAGELVVAAAVGISVAAAVFYTYLTIKQLNGRLPPKGSEDVNIKF